MNLTQHILDLDGEQIVTEVALRKRNAVLLHGAGVTSCGHKYLPIAEALWAAGLGVVLLDFSGHGESSGRLAELSLGRRQRQAEAVINKLVPTDSPLYLVGFSMGAQTVCDLLPIFGERVAGILLGCPAAYREDVHELVFGNPNFTAKLREAGTWSSSLSPQHLRDFAGRVVIGVGSEDETIPAGVIVMLRAGAPEALFHRYDGAGHQLATWWGGHPSELTIAVSEMIGQALKSDRA